MGDFHPAIVCLAAFLAVLSVRPLRRKLPVIRLIPGGVELLFWSFLVLLCAAALASVQTRRSLELGLALERAAIYFGGQAFNSILGSLSKWVADHEAAVVILIVAVVASSWLVIVARALAAFRRARRPRPSLGDWWVVKRNTPPRRRSGRPLSPKVGAFAQRAATRKVEVAPKPGPRPSIAP